MANYLVTDNHLTAIADAIREKGNISNTLEFPDEFIEAIENINTSENLSISPKAVNFYDYDGSLLYSYTAEEFAALENMPENPDHSSDEIPLTSQGWNWTLEDAKNYISKYDVLTIGQSYVTTDGKTYIKVYIEPEVCASCRFLKLRWLQTVSNGVTIDWGDNTEPESYADTQVECTHNYPLGGEYTVILTVNEGEISFQGDTALTTIYGTNAFQYQYKIIKSIRLGQGLKSDGINNYAFNYCYGLETINIPAYITNIGNGAFQHCESLVSIIIPREVTTIPLECFNYCYKAVVISIPYEVVTIEQAAFNHCQMLRSINLKDDANFFSKAIFVDCQSLISYTIPKHMTAIPSDMFSNCRALTSIVIPDTITRIDSSAFWACYNLTSISLPNTITFIYQNAFSGCHSLKSIKLPTSITSIPMSLAYQCDSLLSINIPNSVTIINQTAFNYCQCLTSITIPSKVTKINQQAFSWCTSMAEYHFLPTKPPTLGANVFSAIPSSCIIYVPQGSLEAYKTATNWSAYADQMQEEPS